MVLSKKISILSTIFTLTLGAAFLLLFLYLDHGRPLGAALYIGSVSIPVTIADTFASRQQGLSATVSLPADSGMLFVYDTPGKPGFWMKDMHYPLDLIWMDHDMNIIGITANVAPDTYPAVFYCNDPACPNGETGRVQYVLEVNAGFSTRHGLAVGQHMSRQ